MSKFNLRGILRTGTSAVHTKEQPSGTTFEGAPGYARDAKSELFLLAVTSFVAEATFYEAAAERDARLRDLVAQVALADGQTGDDWTKRFVKWLRTGVHLRSVALVVAAEAVRARLAAGIHGGNRAIVAAALDRADEPGELLAYWTSRYGRAIPKPVKRGVADAATRLYSERSLVKYDGERRGYRFADVLELTHPTPRDELQSALFRHALDRRHDRGEVISEQLAILRARQALLAVPVEQRRDLLSQGDQVLRPTGMGWEHVAGWLQGPMDAAAWEALIPSMGYMALLRNLRNFDEVGVSDGVAAQVAAKLADADEVARSRQLPLRFLAAYRSAPSLRWGWALERALQASLASVPALPGRTLVLVDRSGSMFSTLSRRGSVTRADAAAVFGSAIAMRAAKADLVEFGTTSSAMRLQRGVSLLTLAEQFGDLGGTNTADAVRQHYRDHDRVVIVTDEQAWGGWHGEDPLALVPAGVPTYTFNLAGYRHGHGPSGVGNRHTFGGLTDQGFAAIPLLERGRDQGWPF